MVLQKLFNLRRSLSSKPFLYISIFFLIILLFKNKDELNYNLPSNLTNYNSLISSHSITTSNSPGRCKLNELSSGQWFIKPSPKLTSVNQFLRGTERLNMLECEGTEERLLELNNYWFQSDSSSNREGCDRLEWDPILVVKRLLTMPEGMIIVGDSLGEQFSATFRSLLAINVLIEGSQVKGAILPNGNPINLHKILTLHPKHPIYKTFLEKKEFSEMRLKRPLVQFFRSHHLISDEEISNILTPPSPSSSLPLTSDSDPTDFKSIPLRLDSNPSLESEVVKRIGYPWGSDPDFITFIKNVLTEYRVLPSDYKIGSLENSNPTVLILSSGPHWHTSHFTRIPSSSSTSTTTSSSSSEIESDEDNLDTEIETELNLETNPMLSGYTKMVHLLLTSLPDSSYLHTIIRNSNPVSSTCSSIPQAPTLTSTNEVEKIETGSRYNYDLFPFFDQIWREALRDNIEVYRHSPGGGGVGKRRGKIEIWEDWNMMSKRMEGKKGPTKGDCLHFCIPVLYESARVLMQYLIQG